MPPDAPDKLRKDSTLHLHARRWVEHHCLQIPKPDGPGPQADRRTVQGKRVRAGGEETKRRLQHVERQRAGTAHGGSSIPCG
jgi:hypothetical protein